MYEPENLNYLVYGTSFKASLRSCWATEEISQLTVVARGSEVGTQRKGNMSCILSYVLQPMHIIRS